MSYFNNDRVLERMKIAAEEGKPIEVDKIRLVACADAPIWNIDVLDDHGQVMDSIEYDDDERKAEEDFETLKEITTPNGNCLSGHRCPHCGSTGPFIMDTKCRMEWSDGGVDNGYGFDQNMEMDEEGMADCKICEGSAKIKDFEING